ncbi:hypothetical protein DFH09DRAFT_1165251 [Mycena vulgaris]|nr:hypothetical protein DFH09DRAFT_1165251 [Mycena vulgaris]
MHFMMLRQGVPQQQSGSLEKLMFADLAGSAPLDSNRVVYPVLTLPTEITSEVFIQCLPSRWTPNSTNPHPMCAPLLLLQICNAWRAIALATPELWAPLRLDMMNRREKYSDLPTLERLAAEWFAHACAVPLSLTLRGWCDHQRPCHLPALIDRYAPRLRHLDLEMGVTELSSLSESLEFSALEHLSVHCWFFGPGEINGDMLTHAFKSDTPRLREVKFRRFDSAFLSGWLPWNQLTSFICGEIPAAAFLQVLRWAPLLVQCTVHVDRVPATDQPLLSHVSLASLTLRAGSSAQFLQSLRLSALQSLHISRNVAYIADHSFLQFLDRSAGSLRHFSCENTSTAAVSVDAIHAMPRLTDLALGRVSGILKDDLFRMLDREREPDALPHLANLTINNYAGSVQGDVVQALESRCLPQDGGARLRSFRMVRPQDPVQIGKNQVAAVRRLVVEGMRIHIGDETENVV